MHFQERWKIYGFIASYEHLYLIEKLKGKQLRTFRYAEIE